MSLSNYLVAITFGLIYAQGTPAEIITEEMIQQVFRLECRIITDPVVGTPMCIPISRNKRQLKQIESHC